MFDLEAIFKKIDTVPECKKALRAVYEFATQQYKPASFSTSWSTYSLFTTEEERRIYDLMEALDIFDLPLYVSDFVPALLMRYSAEFGMSKMSEVDAIANFCGDMIRDTLICDLQERDVELD